MPELDFGDIAYSRGDGSELLVMPRSGYYAPDSIEYEESNDYTEQASPWEPVTGKTGQYGYDGPVMHESEVFAGSLEQWCREHAGVYTLTTVDDVETGEPFGWMLLRRAID